MRSIEDRARLAYRRRFGPDADIPSVTADETAGIVELYNVRGVLGAYRIADRGLRWDDRLAKKLQRERARPRRKRITATQGGPS
jgi:hypothetical protein